MKSGIGPHAQLLLDQFGQLVRAAWGERGYLVGSSQRGEAWRDIDVRVMLSNEDYALRLPGVPWQTGMRHRHLGWRAHMLAWSELGRRMTGLPIDFQVERQTESDALWPTGPRNPIGLNLNVPEEDA